MDSINKLYSKFVANRNSKLVDTSRIPNDVWHAMLGIESECGEFTDAIKKTVVYDRQIDYTNLDEEIGDMLWYIQLYANFRNKTIEDFINQNMDKLLIRYPDNEFSKERALNRDLEAERKALEGE